MAKLLAISSFMLLALGIYVPVLSQVTLAGRTQDAATNEGLPGASLVLLALPDTQFVAGQYADSLGNFQLNNVRPGRYVVRALMAGFTESEQEVTVASGASGIQQVPPFRLGALETEGVTITSRREMFTFTPEGLVLNTDASLASQSGTVIDLLRRTPGVRVDNDGNASIRGASGTQILINGRTTSQAENLASIPASSVEQIRVITNPGARYDAEGGGGIIDIRLRRQRAIGVNGTIQGHFAERGRWGLQGNLNWATPRFNVNIGGGTGLGKQFSHVDNDRFLANEGNRPLVLGDEDAHSWHYTPNFRGTFDWLIDSMTTLTVESNYSVNQYYTEAQIINWFYNENAERVDVNVRDTEHFFRWRNWESTLAFQRKLGNGGATLNASGTFTDMDVFGRRTMNYAYALPGTVDPWQPDPERSGSQRVGNGGIRRFGVGSIDFRQPFGEKYTLETGARFTSRQIDSDFTLADRTPGSSEYVLNTLSSNTMLYQEYVYAGYVNGQAKWGKVSLQAGLRYEQTQTEVEQVEQQINVRRSYPSFFPSLSATWEVKGPHTLRLALTRRIDRPRGWWLNPFVDLNDTLDQRTGNPDLNPEYNWALEAGYIFQRPKFTSNFSPFVQHRTGKIQMIHRYEGAIAYVEPRNIGYERNYGIEQLIQTEPLKWLNLDATLLVYYNILRGEAYGVNMGNEFLCASLSATARVQLPKKFGLEINGYFSNNQAVPQGIEYTFQNVTLTATKLLFKDKLRLTLSYQDIFWQQLWGIEILANGLQNNLFSNWDSRMLQFTARYQFAAGQQIRRGIDRSYRQNRIQEGGQG